MRINKTTQCFEDMSWNDFSDMRQFVDQMDDGNVPHPLPGFVSEWMKAFDYSDRQILLVITCGFTPKVLRSMVDFLYNEIVD